MEILYERLNEPKKRSGATKKERQEQERNREKIGLNCIAQAHTINRFKTDRMHSTLAQTTTNMRQHDKRAYAKDLANS